MHPFRHRKYNLHYPVIIIIGWALYAVFFASQSYIQQVHIGKSPGWSRNFVPWVICAAVWAMLTPLILGLAVRFPPAFKRWHYALLVHVPAAVVLSLAQLAVYLVISQLIRGPGSGSSFEQYERLVVEEFHAGILIYFSIVAINTVNTYLFRPRDDSRVARYEAASTEIPDIDQLPAVSSSIDTVVELSNSSPVYLSAIPIKENGRIFRVNPKDIRWINAEGNYVKLHTPERGHLIRGTMNAMEQNLDPSEFVRIRRSTIVRKDQITEIHPTRNGVLKLILRDGTALQSSRRYRKNLETHLRSHTL